MKEKIEIPNEEKKKNNKIKTFVKNNKILTSCALAGFVGLVSLSCILPFVVGTTKEKERHHYIDWEHAHDHIDSFFENRVEEPHKNKHKAHGFKRAHEKAKDLLNHFKKQNFSLEHTFNHLRNNIPQFNEDYQREKEKLRVRELINKNYQQVSLIKKDLLPNWDSKQTDLDIENHKALIYKIRVVKTLLITGAAVAAIAAAGFYTAAFFSFGATTEFAVGCTSVSVALSTAAAAVSGILLAIDKEAASASNFSETREIVGTVFPILQGIATLSSSMAWCCPILTAIALTTNGVLAWLDIHYLTAT